MNKHNNSSEWFLAAFVFVGGVLLYILPLFYVSKHKPIERTEREIIIEQCRAVCHNSDAYDNGTPIVLSCDEILTTYTGDSCYGIN